MRQRRFAQRGLVLAALLSPLFACQSPTQISVDVVTTDVPCAQVTVTTFTSGELGAIESLPPTSESAECTGNHLGTVVLVPSSAGENALVGFKVVTALDGETAAVCSGAGAANNAKCIVERRALRYIPHTPLEVIVDMTAACEGVSCDPQSTCVNGACVPAQIPDPSQCEGNGCNASVLAPPDGGVDAGVDATVDAGVDATVDAGVDAAVDAGVDASDTGAGDSAPDGPPDSAGIDDAAGAACEAGAQACAGDAAVQMCGAAGQWGASWPCATGACSGGACTGVTAGSTFPSCVGGGQGHSDCGPDGGDDCCASLEVPGGTYPLTDSYNSDAPSSATVNGFRLDKYLVTVGRFRQFVNAWDGGAGLTGGGGFEPDAGSGKHIYLNGGLGLIDVGDDGGGFEPGWVASDDGYLTPTNTILACDPADNDWTSAPAGQETLPMNCVGWQEAVAFCIWDGGFLPSEAEWTFAAAGGIQNRLYPWGPTDPSTLVNQYAIYGGQPDGGYNCNYPSGVLQSCSGGNIAPVGLEPGGVARWGQLDMAGEVFEWNLDIPEFYVDGCVDCGYLTGTKQFRATRGGSYHDGPEYMPSQKRWYATLYARASTIGLRCARAP